MSAKQNCAAYCFPVKGSLSFFQGLQAELSYLYSHLGFQRHGFLEEQKWENREVVAEFGEWPHCYSFSVYWAPSAGKVIMNVYWTKVWKRKRNPNSHFESTPFSPCETGSRVVMGESLPFLPAAQHLVAACGGGYLCWEHVAAKATTPGAASGRGCGEQDWRGQRPLGATTVTHFVCPFRPLITCTCFTFVYWFLKHKNI